MHSVGSRVLESCWGEWRWQVEVARERLPAAVPPAHVIAHPRRAHRPGMGVEVGQCLRALQLRAVEIEVHWVEEDGQPLAGLPQRREEGRLEAGLGELQRRGVLDDVEEAGL